MLANVKVDMLIYALYTPSARQSKALSLPPSDTDS